jgi:hypothetical protein
MAGIGSRKVLRVAVEEASDRTVFEDLPDSPGK